MINKNEIKYITYAIGFAAVFFLFLLPTFIDKFDGQSPYFEFLLFNVGLIITLQFVLKSITLKTSLSFITALGLGIMFIALDILQPPYAVMQNGTLISTGPTLMTSSSDYMAGLIAQSFGLTGVYIYGFTYIIAPFILLFIAALLIKDFVKTL